MTVTIWTCRRHGGQSRRIRLPADPDPTYYRCVICDLERRRLLRKADLYQTKHDKEENAAETPG